jgi:hypothetical protein
MKKQDAATVINVSWALGFAPLAMTAVYSSTKAAIQSAHHPASAQFRNDSSVAAADARRRGEATSAAGFRAIIELWASPSWEVWTTNIDLRALRRDLILQKAAGASFWDDRSVIPASIAGVTRIVLMTAEFTPSEMHLLSQGLSGLSPAP